jgi:hypothetical protein
MIRYGSDDLGGVGANVGDCNENVTSSESVKLIVCISLNLIKLPKLVGLAKVDYGFDMLVEV